MIEIKDGRHPVVEKMLKSELFVPNDTFLDMESDRLYIITGPNMAGKSTYMRQVAVITLMAQIGSFVPAASARIGVVDKIFTRVGASDDLATGQSTFMVEMNEVTNILKNATKNSLIILDEIGRGTSTYDGLSIAWAVAEYICDKEKIGAKTLFSTHYHELTELESRLDGVKNYCSVVKKRRRRYYLPAQDCKRRCGRQLRNRGRRAGRWYRRGNAARKGNFPRLRAKRRQQRLVPARGARRTGLCACGLE